MARPRWPLAFKLLVAFFLVVISAGLLFRFRVIIPPLVLAAIVAYVITPAVEFVARRFHLPRTVAAMMVYILLGGLFVGLPFVLVPLAVNQLRGIEIDLQDIVARYTTLRHTVVIVGSFPIDVGAITDRLTNGLTATLDGLAGESLAIVGELLEFFISALVVLIASFYLIKDSARFHGAAENLIPAAYREDYRRLRVEISLIWAAFFRGQIVLALVVTVIFWVVGVVIGLKYPLALALLAGGLEFLPSLGHGIWFVVGVVFALTQGSTVLPIQNWAFALVVAGLHVIFQQIDLNLLIPRIIGRRVKLHPLVVIIGIIVGASFAGVLGVALAAPTIASLRVLGRYTYSGLFDLEPFEPALSRSTDKEATHDR
ncbi:MAG TPA: AI-2E family transporter [Anaerolineales bacterium]|nr:AI-2E family transporter [Anaerolineales bacterium]